MMRASKNKDYAGSISVDFLMIMGHVFKGCMWLKIMIAVRQWKTPASLV
jgi:hypothetical protein